MDDILRLVARTSGVSLEMIRAAVAFWADFPDDIDARIQRSRDLAISTALNSYTVNDGGAWSAERPRIRCCWTRCSRTNWHNNSMISASTAGRCTRIRAEGVADAALKDHRVIVTGNVLDFEEIRRRRGCRKATNGRHHLRH